MKRATRETLYFETGPDNKPTLHVEPGEVFEVETQINRGPWLEDHPDKDALEKKLRGGNPSSGAIFVEGAQPGQRLIVQVGEFDLDPIGYTSFRGENGAMPGWLGGSGVGAHHKVVDIKDGFIHWSDTLEIPISPMLGFVGCALLHIGDMHARQGDGEICGAGGIEAGGRVRIRVELADLPSSMTWPRITNETHIMTTAQARPAEDSFRMALSEMVLWLEDDYGFSRGEAYLFLGQVLEARVTQFVNPTFSYVAKVNRKYLV